MFIIVFISVFCLIYYFSHSNKIYDFVELINDNIYICVIIITFLSILNISIYMSMLFLIIILYKHHNEIPNIFIHTIVGYCDICYEDDGYVLNITTFKSRCHICNFKICLECLSNLQEKICPQCRTKHENDKNIYFRLKCKS